PTALAAAVRGLGVTHVAVDVAGLGAAGDPFEARVGRLWRAFVAEECEAPLVREGDYALYALRPDVGPTELVRARASADSRVPGGLGFYGFRNRQDPSYAGYAFANSSLVRFPRLWDWLGQAGLHTVVLGVPQTYPPSRVNGEMVTCFLTPSTQSAYTHPPE